MWKKQIIPTVTVALIVVTAWIAIPSRNVGGPTAPLTSTEMIAQLDSEALATHVGKRHTGKLPNISVTDQNGRSMAFYDDILRDHAYCVVFFYTNCTGSCPGTTTKMKAIREQLRGMCGQEMKFVSVSLEPKLDTPTELTEYMNRYHIQNTTDMPEWLFLTGQPQEVDELRRAFGLFDPDPAIDKDKTQHAAVMIFGNDRVNRICSLPAGSSTEDLLDTVKRFTGETHRQRYQAVIQKRDQIKSEQIKRSHITDSCCQPKPTL